ncbi:CRISPR-associated protein Cas2 [Persephonella hydrogeniphila]|uniref:CRISPR-associated endoribonuclease Cas2 n=1 Tax=Persephonella hydrogeniphila TaxID=198703 RepID=A0A285NJH9_9AQUI|nr:CRISPR-associated endonuclease Cas2 [Persephonella hydrogeniphila]SNZ09117.1 CRISPR-associated protein Cas2 [Persephonella hydrogeniphila]
MKYLIVYDVADNKRRRKLFKLLLGYGLNVELSVFETVLDKKSLKALTSQIRQIINSKEDVVYIFPYFKEPLRNGVYKGKNYGDIFI